MVYSGIDTRNWGLRVVPQKYQRWHGTLDGLLIDRDNLARRIERMRHWIADDHRDEPLGVVTVLNGGVPFSHALFFGQTLVNPRIEYFRAKSYNGTERGVLELDEEELEAVVGKLQGRHILVVDDVAESGQTLGTIVRGVRSLAVQYGLQSVKVAVLIDKPQARDPRYSLVPDYAGYIVNADQWLLGMGMDGPDGDCWNFDEILVMRKPK